MLLTQLSNVVAMSSRKRSLYSEDRGYRKRHNEPKQDVEKLKKQATKTEPRSAKVKTIQQLQQLLQDATSSSDSSSSTSESKKRKHKKQKENKKKKHHKFSKTSDCSESD
ncbi:retinitis pigmentosa 9 protein [Oncorhynchus kisutch]|uniref:retinitis pigmentosa 9 protein n=1 Tax=Oncorhynchus kisutch TaxID=8019 RepID=UPI0012DFD74A|nr:retinitis pigmentosa 9 protein homolog [Oncorhynchus kisutch]